MSAADEVCTLVENRVRSELILSASASLSLGFGCQSDRLGQLLTNKLTAADRCAGEPSGESCKAFTY
jgi:hypothetical protein